MKALFASLTGKADARLPKQEVPIEQLSHELALRFASQCYSHLEIAHFRENFKDLADHQDEIEYWKEETVSRFLAIPDRLRAGSVVYAMITYLGAFPFPSLAPCIVTRQAMLKAITLLTDRYKKILKRGDQDRNKLLFRSLAVYERSTIPESADQDDTGGTDHPDPYEDEDEEDDDLALAALDALDAIEVFKHDHRQEHKISHAHVPLSSLEAIIKLMLLCAPLTEEDSAAIITTESLTDETMTRLNDSTKALLAVFLGPESQATRIAYGRFVKVMYTLCPDLFRPLSPLFERFMFSKQLDVNKPKAAARLAGEDLVGEPVRSSPLRKNDDQTVSILDEIMLAQISFSLRPSNAETEEGLPWFSKSTHLDKLFSTSTNGTSLSSFSRQVMSWKASSLLLIRGFHASERYVFGLYLSQPWRDASHSTEILEPDKEAILLQLQPRHAVFRANRYNATTSTVHFSTKSGIALGCIIPPSSRLQAANQTPVLGPVSVLIDEDISTAVFQHDASAGSGVFLTDPLLEEDQRRADGNKIQASRLELDVDEVEVWGISFSSGASKDAIDQQRRILKWEEDEAERRRAVNFGGDKDGARHLLEMAGIIDEDNRSGGSIQ